MYSIIIICNISDNKVTLFQFFLMFVDFIILIDAIQVVFFLIIYNIHECIKYSGQSIEVPHVSIFVVSFFLMN